jgi:hypothetical protein
MRKFRIVTNGLKWKVEEYKLVGHLWWRRFEWTTVIFERMSLLRYRGFEEFSSYNDAEQAVEHLVECIKAERNGWHTVKNIDIVECIKTERDGWYTVKTLDVFEWVEMIVVLVILAAICVNEYPPFQL